MLQQLLARPGFFRLTQRLLPFTVWQYQRLLRENVLLPAGAALLDVGCGPGAYSHFFPHCRYVGIDDNPAYVAQAAAADPNATFQVMDAGHLDFPAATFDAVLAIATFHHLDDATVLDCVGQGLAVCKPGGRFHVVEPVYPLEPGHPIKRWVFSRDRGRHQRTLDQLTTLLASRWRVEGVKTLRGPLHDTCYIRLAPPVS